MFDLQDDKQGPVPGIVLGGMGLLPAAAIAGTDAAVAR
ncbi:MAG: hypothetical protein OJF60_003270 [Burkholderiaceae bacterium]|jgi:hypothetical protein|nr:MAG: hypothetical protein OJF60_003270 [Burkholderiaceae bacterium]